MELPSWLKIESIIRSINLSGWFNRKNSHNIKTQINIENFVLNSDTQIQPVKLDGKQKDIGRRLDEFYKKNNFKLNKLPSEIYRGAIFTAQEKLRSNDDWVSQASHSLRELLYPIWSEVRRHSNDDKETLIKDRFKNSGFIFIEVLFEEIKLLYGKLNDLAHHGLEPRNFTKREIEEFNDDDFEKLIDDFNDIMNKVLKVILEAFNDIDETIKQKEFDNLKALKGKLKLFFSEEVTKQYFFYKADEEWLEWLYKNGFLKAIEEKSEDPTRFGYRMPELNYLVKVADKKPEKVTKIILETPISEETFNPEVIAQFLRICEILPANQLAQIVPKIKEDGWVQLMSDFNNWGFEYEKMFKTLAEAEKYEELLILADEVFSIKQEKKEKDDAVLQISDSPFYFNNLMHTKVFEYLNGIPDEYAEEALKLTSKILGKAVTFDAPDRPEDTEIVFKDNENFVLLDVDFFDIELSSISRLSYREDVKALAAVVVGLLRNTIGGNCNKPEEIKKIVKEVWSKLPDTRSMWRLKIFACSLCPKTFNEELNEGFFRLFDVKVRYHEIISGAEYMKALQHSFKELDNEDKRVYVKKVIDYFTEKHKNRENEKENWHLGYGSEILSVIAGELTNEQKKSAEKAGFKIEKDYKPSPSIKTLRGGTVKSRGPISPEEFNELSINDVAKKLTTDWAPDKLKEEFHDDDFLSPRNAEGAGDLLRNDISKRLQDYVNNAHLFFEPGALDQHYTYSFFRGIHEAIKNNPEKAAKVDLSSLVNLLLEIKEEYNPSEFKEREQGSYDAWLAGWDTAHSSIADVIQELLKAQDNTTIIDFKQYRGQLLKILEYLLDYPDPLPEDEEIETAKSKTKSPRDADFMVSDPFTMAINSVRGRAFQALVLFVFHDGKKLEDDVKDLYENLLKNEETRAIMFMFGHYLPTFYLRDKEEWITELLEQIFPKEQKYSLYLASWEGFLSNNLYPEIFKNENFEELYKRGLEIKKDEDPERRKFKDPNESIAIHLALAYIHFKEFHLESELFEEFWKKGNTTRHKEFISFIGKHVISRDNPQSFIKENNIDVDKLKDFWSWALKHVDDAEALTGFGFWIKSENEVFDIKCLAEMVKKTLENSNYELDWDYGLTTSIQDMAKEAPEDTFEIIKLFLLEGGVKQNIITMPFLRDNEWYKALEYIYNNSNKEIQDKVYNLIDDLIREGGQTFWKFENIVREGEE